MKKMRNKILAALIGISFLSFTGHSQSANDEILGGVENTSSFKIVELAQMDRNLSTFMNLVSMADLGPSMALADDYTLLIPTNDAFAEMTIERFAFLTNPKNQVQLLDFIKYHVIPKKLMAFDFKGEDVLSNDGGKDINVTYNSSTFYVGSAKVIKADIVASDGVIHVVNGIVAPTSEGVSEQ